MQPTRTIIRAPNVCRIIKAPAATRNMSIFSAPPFFARFPTSAFPATSNELAPLFRLLDDFTAAPSRAFDHFTPPAQIRPFQPRFDVREVGQNYELRGELPGVESKNLEVAFTDAQTLVIRGRTESETTNGTPSSATAPAIEASEPTATTNAAVDNSDAASTHSASSYQKATVEDEGAAEASASSTPGQATPAESTTPETQQQTVQATSTAAGPQQSQSNTPRYWVSERSTGSFQRVFNFSSRVDQEGVSASLKNGVLNIVVPKAVAPTSRRINVE